MKVRLEARTVILLSIILPFLVLFCLVNTVILQLKDLLGINRLLANLTMRRRYGWNPDMDRHPAPPEQLAAARQRARELCADLARSGWALPPDGLPPVADPAARKDWQRSCMEVSRRGFGFRLPHASARDSHSGKPKRIYWLSGSHFEMGWQLGLMAEADIRCMSVDYVNNVIFDFAGDKHDHPILGTLIADFIYRLASIAKSQIPAELEAEIYGIYAGCQAANPASKVLMRDLLVLNYGIDIILSLVYAGAEPLLRLLGISLEGWKSPAACNGFAVFGQAAGGGAFFGRDFMFPTCGVFGGCAAPLVMSSNGCLGLRDFGRPELKSRPRLVCSITAPGMVGSVATLNQDGLAMGVDMVNGRNSNFFRVGLNSLMMIRYVSHWSADAAQAVRLMRRTPRGVSWLYLLAHGPSQRGAVVEAGSSRQNRRYLRHVPKKLRPALPDYSFIRQHPGTRFIKGMGVRWNNWHYPKEWLDWNQGLYAAMGYPWPEQGWGERDTLCPKGPRERQVPCAFYFAPQRETRPDLVLGCNSYVIPELRLLAMNDWTARLADESGDYDDFQWRYDELNRWILQTLDNGTYDLAACQDTTSFLRPCNPDRSPAPNHFYYGVDRQTGKDIPVDTIPVGGAMAAMDLLALRLRCQYGWFVDDWVELVLEPSWAH